MEFYPEECGGEREGKEREGKEREDRKRGNIVQVHVHYT